VSGLVRAFLWYYLGVILLVTLVPFDFSVPQHFRVLLGGTTPDAAANGAMFVPAGFLFRLTQREGSDPHALLPLCLGAVFSGAIETAQLFLASRYASPADVLTNALGAWLGALGLDTLQRRLSLTPALLGALALELPLMGLVYLLVPLLWLSGLGAAEDHARLVLLVPLGGAGAIVLGAVHRHRLGRAAGIPRWRFALLGCGWFALGALPALFVSWAAVLGGTAAMALGLGLLGQPLSTGSRDERRFESRTVRRLVPVLGIYLVGMAAWPWLAPPQPFHASWGLPLEWSGAATVAILRSLEHFAAFTVVGYLAAESRGRREEPLGRSARALAPLFVILSGVVELALALRPGNGASLLRAGIAAGLATYGAAVYHLQRAQIRLLLGRPAAAGGLTPTGSGRTGAPASAERTG
jgi:glycopeptide antibiotics resistance protein